MKTQATKATTAEIRQHIERQRFLGELMIGEHDRPRAIELVVTAAIVIVVILAHAQEWI